MEFAQKIRERVEALGLRQTEAAARCGIPYRNFNHYATGQREPGLDELRKICAGLELSPNDFFDIPTLPDLLSARERELLFFFQSMPPEHQEAILLLMRSLGGADPKGRLPFTAA